MPKKKTTATGSAAAMSAYATFVNRIACYMENGFISQDANGTDFTLTEPALHRDVGEKRTVYSWSAANRKDHNPANCLSYLFKNVPVHPHPENTLYQIVDGVAIHIPT